MSASWWYVNRAAGLVAWVLLAGSLVVGLLLSGKALGKKVRPNWLLDLHRFLGALDDVLARIGAWPGPALSTSPFRAANPGSTGTVRSWRSAETGGCRCSWVT